MYYTKENGYKENICPICGAEIEPYDGEDNGYGDLHLWWKCEACGASGTAVHDYHGDQEFYYHTVDG